MPDPIRDALQKSIDALAATRDALQASSDDLAAALTRSADVEPLCDAVHRLEARLVVLTEQLAQLHQAVAALRAKLATGSR